MTSEELCYVIRNNYYNNEASIEELASKYVIQESTVRLILDNVLFPTQEFENSCYDDRTRKCGKCGTPVDGDGVPDNCMGDCELTVDEYFDDPPEFAGTPVALNFND